MKSHKYITIITSSVSVIALVLAVVYHCENKEFEANIMVGVFSSGFLAMLVSIIEYANKRRSTLETFYTSAHGVNIAGRRSRLPGGGGATCPDFWSRPACLLVILLFRDPIRRALS